MKALSFWKAVTLDKSNLLEEVFALLQVHGVRFCVIGGQAVNAYVGPLVSLDLDLCGRSNRASSQAHGGTF
jgi:hypothetical protein